MTPPCRIALTLLGSAMVCFAIAGCSSTPSIEGVWSASDGSVTKTINSDGACNGMYYNGGKVLDIGGPETCSLSQNATDGYYSLVVRQPPNQETLQVKFDRTTMTVSSAGSELVTLTKQ